MEQKKTHWLYRVIRWLVWLFSPRFRLVNPEKLPENRVQHGFDNRGFRAPTGATGDGKEVMIGHYRLFVRPLPTEYNVTSITVGFNPGNGIVWRDGFRP